MPDYLQSLSNFLKTLATNRKVGLWFIFLVVVSAGGYFLYYKFKPKKEVAQSECEFIKEQYKELQSAMLDIKKTLSEPISAAYRNQESVVMFASYVDSIPKKTSAQKAIGKIDSVIRRQDSVNRVYQSKKKQ